MERHSLAVGERHEEGKPTAVTAPLEQATTSHRRRRRRLLVPLAIVSVIAVVATVGLAFNRPPESSPTPVATPDGSHAPHPESRSSLPPGLERARELLGEPRSGESWHSGIWAGGDTASGERVEAFGDWRGRPADAITMYPAKESWHTMRNSNWHIYTFAASPAVLSYGLPLMPSDGDESLADIAAGSHDDVFRTIAQQLVDNGRDVTIIRIGWEANGDWFDWSATPDTAQDYIAAFRRVAGIMKEVSPNFVIDFDIGCATKMPGQSDRLDSLTLLYPGDDVVDLIGCDTYDWHTSRSTDEASWELTKRPRNAAGIADVADFAREHGKGLSYPEWGPASTDVDGVGDNPFFIEKMRSFFEENADILVLESYFSEPDTNVSNSIWDPVQMPRSSEEYLRLWGDR